jgi:hypothetical protein
MPTPESPAQPDDELRKQPLVAKDAAPNKDTAPAPVVALPQTVRPPKQDRY